MESFENIKKCWDGNRATIKSSVLLSNKTLENLVRKKLKKSNTLIAQYFWGFMVFQIFIYSILCNLVVKNWGNESVILWSLVGLIVYVPYTIILSRKIKAMKMMNSSQLNAPVQDIYQGIKNEFDVLASLFNMKKKFDWFGVPVICFVLIGLTFELWVPGGLPQNLTGFLISYGLLVSFFCIAIYSENKKHFKGPLQQLGFILDDLKNQ